MTHRRRRLIILGGLCFALLGMTAAAPSVEAHGAPAQLESWGGFAPDAARCQRLISRATSQCVGRVAGLRGACLSGAVRGEACDATLLGTRVDAARTRVLDRVAGTCTAPELRTLGYADLADALNDVISACRQLDSAAMSAAFGPVLLAGTVGRVAEPEASCVQAAAQETTRLLRFGMRVYARVLDRIAALDLPIREKERLLAWAERRIGQTRARSRAALTAACSEGDFTAAYGRSADAYLGDIVNQAACMQQFVYVQDAVRCPTPQCGNGVRDPDEECDDGNDREGDGCRADCVATDCDAFSNSLDLVQQAVFEKYGCTVSSCHGSGQSGGLDLRAGAAYDSLIDLASTVDPARRRVEPGDPQRSVLFLKLAAKTLPAQYPADQLDIGTPMPNGPVPGLTQDELEAVRLWIYGGAPRTGRVKSVGYLLHGCTPEPEPPPDPFYRRNPDDR